MKNKEQINNSNTCSNGLASAMGLNELPEQMSQEIILNNATNNLLSLKYISLKLFLIYYQISNCKSMGM